MDLVFIKYICHTMFCKYKFHIWNLCFLVEKFIIYICVCVCVCIWCYSQEGIIKNMFVGWKKWIVRETTRLSVSEWERLNKDKHMGKQGLWNIKIIYDVWSSYVVWTDDTMDDNISLLLSRIYLQKSS